MKILTIVGARPQFVKAAVVSRAFGKADGVQEIIVHTGQHFDENMSDVFFTEMEIPKPQYNLGINSISHGKMTGRMIEGLEEIMLTEKPDALLIYGDTNSTLAGAIAASKIGVPVAHVEAGLRSFNLEMPEEINRIVADRLSTWLFCPTTTAIQNLHNEGFEHFPCEVLLSGDVMLDAAMYYAQRTRNEQSAIDIPNEPFVLVTIHRDENTKNYDRFSNIVQILNKLAENIRVVLPLHPGTAKKMENFGLKLNFETIAPVGYFDMIRLLEKCSYVVTDSGGLQKEAFFFNKYCFTLRDQTEWTELIDNNVNFLCGVDPERFDHYMKQMPGSFPMDIKLYGDGHAGENIVNALIGNKK